MHNRHDIIWSVDKVDASGVFVKVVVHIRWDWGEVDDDIVVSVWTRLLMPEAYNNRFDYN